MKSQKGFTLVEMTIVIAVIGILMGLVFNGTQSIQANARDTRRIADLKKVQTYLELYYNKCNKYPGDKDCGNVNPVGWGGLVAVLNGSVADVGDIPDKDPKGGDYYYQVTADHFDYTIGTKMEKSIPTGGSTGGSPFAGGEVCGTNNLYCLK